VEQLFQKGKPLKDYLQSGDKGIQEKVKRLYERAQKVEFQQEGLKMKKILLFSEFWCPDCLVLSGALKVFKENNPALEVRVLPRDDYLPILSEHSIDGKARIPLLLVLDEKGQIQGKISEVPSSLREKIKDKNQHRDYRAGKLMEPLMEELKTLLY